MKCNASCRVTAQSPEILRYAQDDKTPVILSAAKDPTPIYVMAM